MSTSIVSESTASSAGNPLTHTYQICSSSNVTEQAKGTISSIVTASIGRHDLEEKDGKLEVTTQKHLSPMDFKTLQSTCRLAVASDRLNREPNPVVLQPIEKRPDTIRVRNISHESTEDELKKDLRNLFKSDPEIHSLCRIPSSKGSGKLSCATVTFSEINNSEIKDQAARAENDPGNRQNLQFDLDFYGVTPLHDEGNSARVDIIAVPGLGTNAFGTFRSAKGDIMWLRDLLRRNVPNCRILIWGYNSHPDRNRNSKAKTNHYASECWNNISIFREMTNSKDKKIIWIGQSLGGLIVQAMLCLCKNKGNERHDYQEDLVERSIGLIGLGVPTRGLNNDQLRDLFKNDEFGRFTAEFCLGENGELPKYLEELDKDFESCSKRDAIAIHYLYEMKTSINRRHPLGEAKMMVEPEEPERAGRHSLIRYVLTDHSGMAKIASPSDQAYNIVHETISSLLRNSDVWNSEEEKRPDSKAEERRQ